MTKKIDSLTPKDWIVTVMPIVTTDGRKGVNVILTDDEGQTVIIGAKDAYKAGGMADALQEAIMCNNDDKVSIRWRL